MKIRTFVTISCLIGMLGVVLKDQPHKQLAELPTVSALQPIGEAVHFPTKDGKEWSMQPIGEKVLLVLYEYGEPSAMKEVEREEAEQFFFTHAKFAPGERERLEQVLQGKPIK